MRHPIFNDDMSDLPFGWLSKLEADTLVQAIKASEGVGDFVEIGAHLGRSTIVIGEFVKKLRSRLFCIDIWAERTNFNQFVANVSAWGLGDVVAPICGLSEVILADWDAPVRFIYVDGCHEYESVVKDTEWRLKLCLGGVIAFHDYTKVWGNFDGVRRAIDETVVIDDRFERLCSGDSVVAFKKVKDG